MKLLVLGDAASIHHRRIVSRFVSQGCEIVFASFTPESIPGVEMISLASGPGRTRGIPGIRFLQKARLLRRIVKERGIDLIHAHYITVYGLLAIAAGRIPKVLTVHGSDVLIARRALYNRLVIRLVARGVDCITSPSQQMTEALVDLGARRDRIETFQYGVDLEKFHPREAPPFGNDPVGIISLRQLAPLYRIDLLLMALSRMACREGVTAWVAGDGPDAEALAHLGWSLELDETVRFLGALDEDAVADALRAVDVYVSTSPSDGASLSLLEAMATGLLPVVTDIPANRAWIRHGGNGLLFRPGSPDALAEALSRAAHDVGLREKARAENPVIVRERADLSLGIQRLTRIFEGLLEKAPTGGRA